MGICYLLLEMTVLWSDEDKTMVTAVLGAKAFDYLMSSLVSAECSLISMGSNENLQNILSDLVERRMEVILVGITLFFGRFRGLS